MHSRSIYLFPELILKIIIYKEITNGGYMQIFSFKVLIGGTITKEITTKDLNDEDVDGFQVVNNGKTYNCSVLGDEDGNYPGALEITEGK